MSQDTSNVSSTSYGTQTQGSNGLAIAGLVCGLAGVLFFNYILGPLAIIFGGVGWSRANNGAPHKGMAIAAVILGVVDLIIWGVLLAVLVRHHGTFSYHVG